MANLTTIMVEELSPVLLLMFLNPICGLGGGEEA